MNICLIYYTYPIYEGGSHIQDFVIKLCEQVEKVTLFASHNPKVNIDKKSNLSVRWLPYIKMKVLGDIVFMISLMVKMLVSKDVAECNLIHVISARGLIPAYLVSKIKHKPLIATVEIINNPDLSMIDNLCYRIQKFSYSLNGIKKIICWSRYHYKKYLYRWGIPENKVEFIGNGINTEIYNPADKDVMEKSIALRNLYRHNGLLLVFAKPLYQYNYITAEIIVKAVAILKSQGLLVDLLLGTGQYRKQLDDLVSIMKVEDLIHFMPWVSMKEIPGYIAAADIIALPYAYEATVSRSLLEAMSLGKAVIVSNLGEPIDIIDNNVDGIIVEPREEALAEKILYLRNNPSKIKHLGSNAREKVVREYSIEHAVIKTVSVYNKLAQ